jgi:hypothetical protein
MSNKFNAYALAMAIYAGHEELSIEDLEERLYKTMNAVFIGSDEVKADIYAQLAETLTTTTPFVEAVSIIEAAMDSTLYYANTPRRSNGLPSTQSR